VLAWEFQQNHHADIFWVNLWAFIEEKKRLGQAVNFQKFLLELELDFFAIKIKNSIHSFKNIKKS
jgi:hypothetical protein